MVDEKWLLGNITRIKMAAEKSSVPPIIFLLLKIFWCGFDNEIKWAGESFAQIWYLKIWLGWVGFETSFQIRCKSQYCVIHQFEGLVEVLHEVQPQPVESSPSRRLDRPAKVEETRPYHIIKPTYVSGLARLSTSNIPCVWVCGRSTLLVYHILILPPLPFVCSLWGSDCNCLHSHQLKKQFSVIFFSKQILVPLIFQLFIQWYKK